MATAPRPGSTEAAKDRTIIITVRGEKSVLRIGDLGPRDGDLVRHETKAAGVEKVSLMGALSALDEETIDLDRICLLWWLGRRKGGDTTETFGEALDAFPNYIEAGNAIAVEELVDDDVDDDGDLSPEA